MKLIVEVNTNEREWSGASHNRTRRRLSHLITATIAEVLDTEDVMLKSIIITRGEDVRAKRRVTKS